MPGTAGFQARTQSGLEATMQGSYKTLRVARVMGGLDGKRIRAGFGRERARGPGEGLSPRRCTCSWHSWSRGENGGFSSGG